MNREEIIKKMGEGTLQRRSRMAGRQQYHLNLPTDLYAALEKIAAEEDETVATVMRKFLELGIEAYNLATGYPRMVHISDPQGAKTKTVVL